MSTPGQRTWGTADFHPTGELVALPELEDWVPVLVKWTPAVRMMETGPHLARIMVDKDVALFFWEYVWKQGWQWMWSYLEGHHQSMKWVACALEQGKVIMVSDGTYNKALDPTRYLRVRVDDRMHATMETKAGSY